jgi:hypothetical protein
LLSKELLIPLETIPAKMRLFLILLFLSTVQIYSQTSDGLPKKSKSTIKLNGTYYSPPDFSGFSITFTRNGLFEYNLSSCTSWETGKGRYTIDGNKLSMSFINTDTTLKPLALKNINYKNPDSVIIVFRVLDMRTNKPIEDALIIARETLISTRTDERGYATICLKKGISKTEIIIRELEYKPFSFSPTIDSSKEFEIHLETIGSIVRNGTKWSFEIIEVSTYQITLKRDDWSSETILTKAPRQKLSPLKNLKDHRKRRNFEKYLYSRP